MSIKKNIMRNLVKILEPILVNTEFKRNYIEFKNEMANNFLSLCELNIRNTDYEELKSNKPKEKKNYYTVEQSLELLKEKAPKAYEEWIKLFRANETAYNKTAEGNLSVLPTKEVLEFNRWVKALASGYVLDIGCGPQPLPKYLENYPINLIYGIDPISEKEVHKFEFINCVAEYLPYEDSQFDTIIIGTSLDHVLLLDQVLLEVERVLKDSGRLIIYLSFSKGASKYDPYAENIKPIDQYHLFHFDKWWFEEVMNEKFVKKFCMQTDNGNYFYAFDLRQ